MTGVFRPYIALFDPQKRGIENSICLIQSYIAHFTPKNVHIALFSGGISIAFQLNSISYLGPTPFVEIQSVILVRPPSLSSSMDAMVIYS